MTIKQAELGSSTMTSVTKRQQSAKPRPKLVNSVRSPAPNGRYRAPAPSALTKLFAFVQIAARDPPGLPIESPQRRRPPRSTTNNNLLFQVLTR
ncbi:hypothetical protein EVAR_83352_1 [Eumeta japonica]|uniref:Uncharacterized protein n=1 Tax=Eumeta variegata TaxID=151549 RepID=A0A4C1VVQ3_EUMVA|nr:hypothetical protein EVAR_83352_1 [Eumeta japonica]